MLRVLSLGKIIHLHFLYPGVSGYQFYWGRFPATDWRPVLWVVRATCQPNVTEIGDWLRPYEPYGSKIKKKKRKDKLISMYSELEFWQLRLTYMLFKYVILIGCLQERWKDCPGLQGTRRICASPGSGVTGRSFVVDHHLYVSFRTFNLKILSYSFKLG